MGGDLLWLSLFSRNPRRESIDRASDRFFDADLDLHAAQPGGDRLDRAKLLGFPGYCVGGDFSAGTATWFGCAWRTSDFFPDQRKTRNGPRSGRGSNAVGKQTVRRTHR